jgi:hypothetical protein
MVSSLQGVRCVKKLIIGCGLAAVLIAVSGMVGMYYFVYKPARAFVASVGPAAVDDEKAMVVNTATFTPPTHGTLTEAQVTRFVAVQESLHARLGDRAREMEAKYKALTTAKDGPRGVTEAIGAYRDVLGLIAEARKAQVDALNAQQFSMDEYTWVKRRFYEAAGVEVTGIDLRDVAGKLQEGDFASLQELASRTAAGSDEAPASAGRGKASGTAAAPGGSIPAANRTLVAPYKDRMTSWVAYAMLGL